MLDKLNLVSSHRSYEDSPPRIVQDFNLECIDRAGIYIKDDCQRTWRNIILGDALRDSHHIEQSDFPRHGTNSVVRLGVAEPALTIHAVRTMPEPLGPVTGMSTVNR